jgi:hypothetical protein
MMRSGYHRTALDEDFIGACLPVFDDGSWHRTDLTILLSNVYYWRQNRKHLLLASIAHFDPIRKSQPLHSKLSITDLRVGQEHGRTILLSDERSCNVSIGAKRIWYDQKARCLQIMANRSGH